MEFFYRGNLAVIELPLRIVPEEHDPGTFLQVQFLRGGVHGLRIVSLKHRQVNVIFGGKIGHPLRIYGIGLGIVRR